MLKAPRSKGLKLYNDEPPSNVAVKYNLRHYTVVAHFTDCSFNSGSTTLGGGVFSVTNGALMTFRRSSFDSNTATNYGGVGQGPTLVHFSA